MHKPRLTRLFSTHIKQPLYFLTLCTHDRKQLLAEPTIHDSFVRFCESGYDHGAFVLKYVLMPDHLHPFATFASGQIAVSVWVKSLKNSLSKTWREMGQPSPHWQKGFFDHVRRSAESYEEKWHYVAQNPVRAGLAAAEADWPYAGAIGELTFRRRS